MTTGIEEQRVNRPPGSGFSFKDLALTGIWLLLAVAYFIYVFVAATDRLNTTWVDTAIFSGAIFCFAFDRSRTVYLILAAIPLFAVAMLLGVPPLHAAWLMIGCGGIIVLVFYALTGNALARQNLQIAVLLPLFAVATNFGNDLIARLTSHLYDATLLRLDCGVSAALRAWTLASPLRSATADIFYGALPLAVAIGIASTSGRDRSHMIRALILAALLAVPCYILVPAVGPVHIHQPLSPRNCVPSLHLTWTLLVWLNVRPVWLRRCAFAFVLMTVFSTLATGEHYVIDLIVALPFTWVVQQLSAPHPRGC